MHEQTGNIVGSWKDIDQPKGSLTVNLGNVSIEHGARYLLTVNNDGTPNVSPIPADAAIASIEQYLERLNEPNGAYISTDVLERLIRAAQERLDHRLAFERNRAAIVESEGVEA